MSSTWTPHARRAEGPQDQPGQAVPQPGARRRLRPGQPRRAACGTRNGSPAGSSRRSPRPASPSGRTRCRDPAARPAAHPRDAAPSGRHPGQGRLRAARARQRHDHPRDLRPRHAGHAGPGRGEVRRPDGRRSLMSPPAGGIAGPSCDARARSITAVSRGHFHGQREAPRASDLQRLGAPSVREGGFEPPRPFGHWHLKPARLPFRHSRALTQCGVRRPITQNRPVASSVHLSDAG